MIRIDKIGGRFFAVFLVACMIAGLFSGCRERSEEQSEALVALQKTVDYYEASSELPDWQELVALYGAAQTDGIGVKWDTLNIPETPAPDGTAMAYAQAIISNMTKGSPDQELVKQLASLQDPTSGSFSADSISSHIWAMISLNISQGSENYNYTDAVKHLLTFQLQDGGFSADPQANESDIELSGIAAIALSPYYQANSDNGAVKKLIRFFTERQLPSGGYAGSEGESVNAVAAVISGLTALEESLPKSKDEKKNPLDALLSFQNEDGSFSSSSNTAGTVDIQATNKATIALCDIVNGSSTYTLLARAAQDYRLEHTSGPSITLSIDYPYESNRKDLEGEELTVNQGYTVLDALLYYGKIAEMPIKTSGRGENTKVISINEVKNQEYGDASSGWACKVNGVDIVSNPAIQQLQEGDQVQWVYVMPKLTVPTVDSTESALGTSPSATLMPTVQ